MPEFIRYAIYFAPPAQSGLAVFGAQWLGWDAATGQPLDMAWHPAPQAVQKPRKYGFHGTLKPPFKLAERRTAAELEHAVAALAQGFAPFSVKMRLAQIGRFLAIVPSTESAALSHLAASCVRQLDDFRAPADAAELARRRANGLSPLQEALLSRWGYPFVLDAFRFHLTLSGPLLDDEADALLAELEPRLARLLERPIPFADICLFAQDRDGMFHILRRFPLTGSHGNQML